MTKKTARSQTRSIGLVGLVNVATAVVGILQAFVVGRVFGVSSDIEIYFSAIVFYQSVLRLTQTGQISEIFTPTYCELKVSSGQQTAYDLLSVLLNWLIVFAIALSAIAYWIAPWIIPWIVPGFDATRQASCAQMFRAVIPLLGLAIVQSLLQNLMVIEKQFVAPEICRLGCLIVGIILIVSLSGSMGAWVMILAMWVSSLTTLIALGYLLRRHGYRYSLCFSHTEFSVWSIFRNLPSIFGYVLCTQIYSLTLTAGLSLLPQGSLAIFTYARKIISQLRSVLLRPISVVFFSHFSSALAEGDQAVNQLTHKALKLTLVVVTFSSVATVAAGNYGLRALWLSEKFPESSVVQTYWVVCILCLLTSLLGMSLIFRKINMAHQLFRRQYVLLTLVSIALAPMAYFLIPIYGLTGAVFVLVSHAILISISSGVLLKITHPLSFAMYRLADIYKCLAILIVSIAPVLWLQFQLNFYPSPWGGRLGDLIASIIFFTISMLMATLAAYMLRIEEVRTVLKMLARQSRRLI